MRILLLSLILSFFTTLTHSLPHYGVTLPPPPTDPAKPPTSPYYPWKSRLASSADHVDKTTLYSIARAAHNQGQTHFADYLKHYLGNTGRDAHVSVDEMLSAMPQFRTEVHELATFKAKLAYEAVMMTRPDEAPVVPFTSFWHEYVATPDQSWDWFLSVGRFVYSVTGVVKMDEETGGVTVHYAVHVFTYCDWDGGRDVRIGQFRFDEGRLAGLQMTGLAREFKIRGSSQSRLIEGYNPVQGF
ncbi:stress-induced bacterial acidophilic repeat motif family protein [Aspergillus tubingensis]|uniref:Similar to An12g10170 n=1 Tax=Aspergillus niger TaxID=5061 RepID=A0A100IUP0_ASPNG|nr:stress-induced bacterial acidophilic repeat motif family protein [Aspergillus tubingensis]GAQ47685.1 similar to An12g10170 [Aspergillus niger]GFN11480.1 stress-induced bacterial acidophilic repeat motif family protein [Aspergillus tubingensis]